MDSTTEVLLQTGLTLGTREGALQIETTSGVREVTRVMTHIGGADLVIVTIQVTETSTTVTPQEGLIGITDHHHQTSGTVEDQDHRIMECQTMGGACHHLIETVEAGHSTHQVTDQDHLSWIETGLSLLSDPEITSGITVDEIRENGHQALMGEIIGHEITRLIGMVIDLSHHSLNGGEKRIQR